MDKLDVRKIPIAEQGYSRGIHQSAMTLKEIFIDLKKIYNENFKIKDFRWEIESVIVYSNFIEDEIKNHMDRFNKKEIEKHNNTGFHKDFDGKAQILSWINEVIPLQSTVKRLRMEVDLTMKDFINIKYDENNDPDDNKMDLDYIKSDVFKDRFSSLGEVISETEEKAEEYTSILKTKFSKLLKEDQKLRDSEIEVNSETPSF